MYHCTISIWCEPKGRGDQFVVKCFKRYVEQRAKDVAMRVFLEMPNCIIRTSPRASKEATAWCRYCTQLLIARRHGVVLVLRSPLTAWIVRHASRIHDRFFVHRSNNQTPTERQHERAFRKNDPDWRDNHLGDAWTHWRQF